LNAETVIATVANAGGEMTVSGGRIRYRLPKNHPEKERILAGLREHKPEIIRLLSVRPQTCSSSCYEIKTECWIHHPWDGCKTCLAHFPASKTGNTLEMCWHCGGRGECACVSCGRYVTYPSWKAGPCVPCRLKKREQVQ
jgi:hypothetical protein